MKRLYSGLKNKFAVSAMGVLFFLGGAASVYAAGITIPASSSINVNTGTLNVAGDIPFSLNPVRNGVRLRRISNGVNPLRFVQGSLNIHEGLFRESLGCCGLQRWEAVNQQELQAGVLNQAFYRFGGRLSGGQTRNPRIIRIFQTSYNELEQDGSKQHLFI